METVHVTIKNGITLDATQAIAIDPYKIVWIKKYTDGVSTLARILYCRNKDRREPCDDMYCTETYAAIAAIVAALDVPLFNEYTVYTDFVEGSQMGTWTGQEAQTYNDEFIEDIMATNEHVLPIFINYNSARTQAGVIHYCEGAFKRKKVYIDVLSVPEGLITTTTTEEPVTTTTTEESTTTTTTLELQ